MGLPVPRVSSPHPQRPLLVSLLQDSGADERRRTLTPLALRYSLLESTAGTHLSVLTPIQGAARGVMSPGAPRADTIGSALGWGLHDPLRLSCQSGDTERDLSAL